MIPFFPILSGLAAALGLGGLWWYSQLSPAEKKRADAMARDFALDMFGKELESLNRDEMKRVHSRVEPFFRK